MLRNGDYIVFPQLLELELGISTSNELSVL